MLAEMLALAPGGIEERALPSGDVEYSVYGPPGELPELPALEAAAGDALVEVYTEELADDWHERWREFHRPLVIDDRLTVRPPWQPAADRAALDVVIDPGRAFGTGAHATTRLCLEAMLELQPGGPFVDLGCGSGVLAVTASKLGWRPVVALDYDAAAAEATVENARRNGVELEARRYDLRTDPVETAVAPTVSANLLAPLLTTWAERLRGASRVPGRVIASGVLAHEGDRVAGAFEPLGLRETRRLSRGDWIALVLTASERCGFA